MRIVAPIATSLIVCFSFSPTLLAQHTVATNGERRTLDCGGQDLKVTGSRNELTLTGDCPRIDVAGAGNTVSADGTGHIDVTGSGNRVTWQRALNGRAPRVSSTGLNSVERISASVPPSQTRRSPSSGASTPPAPAKAPSSSKTGAPPRPRQSDSTTAAEVSVLTDDNRDTIDCRGRDVTIAGSGNRLTLLGNCPRVTVTGERNTLSIEIATALVVSGSGNELTWSRSAVGETPAVTVTGERNRIVRRTPQ